MVLIVFNNFFSAIFQSSSVWCLKGSHGFHYLLTVSVQWNFMWDQSMGNSQSQNNWSFLSLWILAWFFFFRLDPNLKTRKTCCSFYFLYFLCILTIVFEETQYSWGWRGLLEVCSTTFCSKKSAIAGSYEWTLTFSKDGDSKTSLGSLFQCLTLLMVKKK